MNVRNHLGLVCFGLWEDRHKSLWMGVKGMVGVYGVLGYDDRCCLVDSQTSHFISRLT